MKFLFKGELWIMWNLLKSRMVREEGQSLVEYALIISLVAIVLVAGLTALGGSLQGTMTTIVGSL
jgi:pilus assembly protein Flp/PilA